MKKGVISILVVFCFLLGLAALAQKRRVQRLPCEKTAVTQLEMNNCAHQEYVKADAEMNRVYKQLMSVLTADQAKDQTKLREAQRAWVKYRDANCESESSLNEGGTIYPMVYDFCLASMTEERTKRLRDMLANSQ